MKKLSVAVRPVSRYAYGSLLSLARLGYGVAQASENNGIEKERLLPEPAFLRWRQKWIPFPLCLILSAFLPTAVALGDNCNPGFGVCNHHDSKPYETLTYPAVWIVYWGPDWGDGANGGGFPKNVLGTTVTETEYINYLELFIQTIGGTPYLDSQTQYGAGNQPNRLIDHWFDNSPIPNTPSNGDIQGEVISAYSHFAAEIGSNDQAIIVVALPPGHGDQSFITNGGPACAYHSYVNSVFGQANSTIAYYIVLPFQADTKKCFAFSGNSSNDSFGHGALDGVSKFFGHEYAETITDPQGRSWYGANGETGDLCNGVISNIGEPGQFGQSFFWTAQSLWSNNDDACVLGDAPVITANASLDFGSVTIRTISAPQSVFAGNSGNADFSTVVQPSPWQLNDPTHSFVISPATWKL